jgi:hypothetical protein
MAGAYGLALQAMGQGKISSSLLPQEIRQAKIWKEKTKWFATAAAICVAAAGVKYGTYYFHNDKFESNAAMQQQIDRTVRDAEGFDRDWATVESSGGPDKIKVSNINSLQTYRDVWADLWYDITRALPAQNGDSPEKLKAIPRAERQQVFIESVNSQYLADLGPTLKMDSENFKMLAQPSAGPGGGQVQQAYAPANVGVDRGGRFAGGRGMYDESAGRGRYAPPAAQAGQEGNGAGTPTPAEFRGYLVTLELTSPNKAAPTLVDGTLLKDLMDRVSQANALKEHKNYYVARAMIVRAQQIRSDEVRKAALKAAFDAKKAAQEQAAQPVDPQRGLQPLPGRGEYGGGRGEYGGRGAYDRGGYGRGSYGGDRGAAAGFGGGGRTGAPNIPMPAIQRPGGGGGTGAIDTAEQDKLNAEAYVDPLYPKEQVLGDWEITVVIAIVLDPKAPETKTAENATASAGVDPADDRRATVIPVSAAR